LNDFSCRDPNPIPAEPLQGAISHTVYDAPDTGPNDRGLADWARLCGGIERQASLRPLVIRTDVIANEFDDGMSVNRIVG
jgi:hypothetical protein